MLDEDVLFPVKCAISKAVCFRLEITYNCQLLVNVPGPGD
jgi:hypothetical protein